MDNFVGVIFLSSGYPILRAWLANRNTSLLLSIYWAICAWLIWVWVLFCPTALDPGLSPEWHLALCMSGAAVIAVLGARWPGSDAWNFVVVGFLAVALLPMAEGFLKRDQFNSNWPLTLIPAAALAMGVLNYLPTPLGPAAVILASAWIIEILKLDAPPGLKDKMFSFVALSKWLLVAGPWLAWVGIKLRKRPLSQFDILWLDFRDRFGLIWGQRLRDQFNRSAYNAKWPVFLYWNGLRHEAQLPSHEVQRDMLITLHALMKRFWRDSGSAGSSYTE